MVSDYGWQCWVGDITWSYGDGRVDGVLCFQPGPFDLGGACNGLGRVDGVFCFQLGIVGLGGVCDGGGCVVFCLQPRIGDLGGACDVVEAAGFLGGGDVCGGRGLGVGRV